MTFSRHGTSLHIFQARHEVKQWIRLDRSGFSDLRRSTEQVRHLWSRKRSRTTSNEWSWAVWKNREDVPCLLTCPIATAQFRIQCLAICAPTTKCSRALFDARGRRRQGTTSQTNYTSYNWCATTYGVGGPLSPSQKAWPFFCGIIRGVTFVPRVNALQICTQSEAFSRFMPIPSSRSQHLGSDDFELAQQWCAVAVPGVLRRWFASRGNLTRTADDAVQAAGKARGHSSDVLQNINIACGAWNAIHGKKSKREILAMSLKVLYRMAEAAGPLMNEMKDQPTYFVTVSTASRALWRAEPCLMCNLPPHCRCGLSRPQSWMEVVFGACGRTRRTGLPFVARTRRLQ